MFTLSLEITNDCNLDCDYCYLEKEKMDMSLETALNALDRAFEEMKLNEENLLMVNFLGGEPLLRFSLIKKIVDYAKEKSRVEGISCVFAITTNGTVFTKEIISLLINNRFDISVSIDGIKSCHDKNRHSKIGESSYDMLYKNIHYLETYETQVQKRVQISMVIDKDTIHDICLNFQHIIELGFSCVKTSLNQEVSWSKNELDIVEAEFLKLTDKYFNEFIKGRIIWNVIQQIVDIKSQNFKHFYCGAGKSKIYVKPDGVIYICPVACSDIFKIGHVKSSIIKYDSFCNYKRNFKKNSCLKCENIKYCMGLDCIVLNYQKTGDFNVVPYHVCRMTSLRLNIFKRLTSNSKEYNNLSENTCGGIV